MFCVMFCKAIKVYYSKFINYREASSFVNITFEIIFVKFKIIVPHPVNVKFCRNDIFQMYSLNVCTCTVFMHLNVLFPFIISFGLANCIRCCYILALVVMVLC